jgi:hypothetical protein
MRDYVLFGASALVLVLGIATASAQPSGPSFLTRGDAGVVQTYAPTFHEGRAAAIEIPAFENSFNQHHAGR